MKDLKPNWPAMTKNQQREKSLKKKQQTNETVASGEKRKTTETKQRGYFACIQTRRLQHERHKKKQDKTKNQ